MKKMLSLVLTLALLLSVMVLPASAETVKEVNGGEPCTIRIAWWGNQTRNDLTTQVLAMYTALHPNVTFETEPTAWDGYWDKLALERQLGEGIGCCPLGPGTIVYRRGAGHPS